MYALSILGEGIVEELEALMRKVLPSRASIYFNQPKVVTVTVGGV